MQARNAERRAGSIAVLAAGLAGLCSTFAFASASAQTDVQAPVNNGARQPAAPPVAAQQPREEFQSSANTTPAENAATAGADVPQPFVAIYAVEWRGMGAGTSTVELTKTSPNSFRYASRNAARGIFRVALPGTITQTSELSIIDGKVVPQSFNADDGSSDTARDVHLKFDWNAKQVTGTAEKQPVSEPLEAGVQDAGSVQIALMRELAAGRSPTRFMMIDKNEVKEYQYAREGEASVDTPLGKLDTVIYTSQRAGSTRLTRLWIAPSLGYVPVRAEQLRKGKREFTMQLRSLER